MSASVTDIATRLAATMPRQDQDRPALRQGVRCSITARGITANGTVVYGYGAGDTRFVVRLDGTEQVVDVPLTMIGMEATL